MDIGSATIGDLSSYLKAEYSNDIRRVSLPSLLNYRNSNKKSPNLDVDNNKVVRCAEKLAEDQKRMKELVKSVRKFDVQSHEKRLFEPFEVLHKRLEQDHLKIKNGDEQVVVLRSRGLSNDELNYYESSGSEMANLDNQLERLSTGSASTDEQDMDQVDITKSMQRRTYDTRLSTPMVLYDRLRGNSCPPKVLPYGAKSATRKSIILPGITNFLKRKKKSTLFTDAELETIEGSRWKIIELAFRMGGKHRYYLAQAVNMFYPLTKYGRRGEPHRTRLHIDNNGHLQWQQKRGGLSRPFDLASTSEIVEGRHTSVFRKFDNCSNLQTRSMSLIFPNRTLDLETIGCDHRDWLLSALRTLVSYAKQHHRKQHENTISGKDETKLDNLCHKLFGMPAAA